MTLFEKYGGFATVSKIVMSFYDKILDSERVGDYFEDVDMQNLIDHQTKFVATLMGGPATYTNDYLQRVHANHQIDDADFDETAKLMRDTLKEFGVEDDDVRIILSEIEARRSIIVSA